MRKSEADFIEKAKEWHTAVEALEAQAGITAAMKRAAEGPGFPRGAFGEDTTADEYDGDEYDYLRDATREAYFGVPDIELRKKLIAARLAYEKCAHRDDDRPVWSINRSWTS